MAEKPDVDWDALQVLIDLWLSDQDAALRATRLLPEATLLRRFGPPTELWDGNWIYGRAFDPETRTFATSVHFDIEDGRVSFVNVDS